MIFWNSWLNYVHFLSSIGICIQLSHWLFCPYCLNSSLTPPSSLSRQDQAKKQEYCIPVVPYHVSWNGSRTTPVLQEAPKREFYAPLSFANATDHVFLQAYSWHKLTSHVNCKYLADKRKDHLDVTLHFPYVLYHRTPPRPSFVMKHLVVSAGVSVPWWIF